MTSATGNPVLRRLQLVSLVTLAGLLAFYATPLKAAPKQVVADLSEDLVEIKSGYHGTELLLFGAYRGAPGDDLILEVRGPATDLLQRRKEQKAGIWINVETRKWLDVPSFYHLFSTRPIADIAGRDTLGDAGIGTSSLGLQLAITANEGSAHQSGDTRGYRCRCRRYKHAN